MSGARRVLFRSGGDLQLSRALASLDARAKKTYELRAGGNGPPAGTEGRGQFRARSESQPQRPTERK